jgi:acyl-CoA dehydrogenase
MKCRRAGIGASNGSKHFISHADIADFIIVFVATGEEAEAVRGSACLLPRRSRYANRSAFNSVSHRGYAATAASTTADVGIPGEEGRGFALATWLHATRLTVAAMRWARLPRLRSRARCGAARAVRQTIPKCSGRPIRSPP